MLTNDIIKMMMGVPHYPDSVDDDFPGADGDAPDGVLWRLEGVAPNESVRIVDNKLHFAVINHDGTTHDNYVSSNYALENNLDVVVDFLNFNFTSHTSGLGLQAFIDTNNIIQVFAFYSNGVNKFLSQIKCSGVWESSTYTNRSNNFGSLKIVRSGTSITSYTKDGSASSVEHKQKTGFSIDDMQIRLIGRSGSTQVSGTMSGDFDNFAVNAGTIVWP